jgi:hypothetical protein
MGLAESVRQEAAKYPNLPIAWKNAGRAVHKWRYRETTKFHFDRLVGTDVAIATGRMRHRRRA